MDKEYLLGKRVIMPYRILWVIAAFVGSVTSMAFIWDLADAMNAMMAIPNLISLLALSSVIVAETNHYLWKDRMDEVSVDKIPEIT